MVTPYVLSDCPCCGGGGVVTTDCCPDPLPTTLHVTVTSKTGGCSCLPDSFELDWNPALSRWESAIVCGVDNSQHKFFCDGDSVGNFRITIVGADTAIIRIDDCSCDPFQVVFDASYISTCSGLATLTVTL